MKMYKLITLRVSPHIPNTSTWKTVDKNRIDSAEVKCLRAMDYAVYLNGTDTQWIGNNGITSIWS
jgi:hypothetical protein